MGITELKKIFFWKFQILINLDREEPKFPRIYDQIKLILCFKIIMICNLKIHTCHLGYSLLFRTIKRCHVYTKTVWITKYGSNIVFQCRIKQKTRYRQLKFVIIIIFLCGDLNNLFLTIRVHNVMLNLISSDLHQIQGFDVILYLEKMNF